MIIWANANGKMMALRAFRKVTKENDKKVLKDQRIGQHIIASALKLKAQYLAKNPFAIQIKKIHISNLLEDVQR